jgi:hypothetical protein
VLDVLTEWGIDWLLYRETVIALALLGGAVSIVAMLLQRRPDFPAVRTVLLNRVAYIFMGASMVLFILSGLLGGAA